jgi:hypothetical protein
MSDVQSGNFYRQKRLKCKGSCNSIRQLDTEAFSTTMMSYGGKDGNILLKT